MTDSGEKSVQSDRIPDAIVDREQWICWRIKDRNGKATKVPIVPGTGEYASATDPKTWRPFDEALEYLEDGDAAGIGFVFTEDDPFVGIDLDDCRDPETGSPSTDAREIIVELDSFTEVSPSGTGYHVIVRGSLPGDRSRRGSVEMYETARFFTVTGDHVDATPARVRERSASLEAVYNEYIAETESSAEPGQQTLDADHDSAGDVNTGTSSQQPTLEDEELLEKARSASNGEKFDRLWRGSTTGYESQSEADMALCCLLAFWTGGDAARVDRLFRQSGLIRGKWDDVHYSDGSTYGEKTVERAIANTDDVYDPSSEKPSGEKVGHRESRDVSTSSTEQTVGGTDGARAAYLAEKNQLLSERMTDLEAVLEQKDDRIERLEQENRALRERLEVSEERLERFNQQPAIDTDSDTTSGDGRGSVWNRAKRFVRDKNK
ncbi:hypothetical protein OB955_22340 [Halobacteria archaeon AArc-m2/3/4]|uniref:NrS-1 polymerase-like HBD domain-containing protein n=1 Tax=Natronoglomus mannanivorans TaxID=2979990 RepID=A0ABT2QKG5_9EURY|nr:hypothetical protein [Halobacteria archaeon AArc-m2/3/4]